MKIVLLLFMLSSYAPYNWAQDSILDQYVEQALSNNLSIKGEELRRNKQMVIIEQANKNWMPSVDVNANYLFSTGGRLINFPIGDLFNPVYGALNDVTQSNQFPTNLENEKFNLHPIISLMYSSPLLSLSSTARLSIINKFKRPLSNSMMLI